MGRDASNGKHKEQSALSEKNNLCVEAWKGHAVLLPEGRCFLAFWPLGRKLKEKFLCDLGGSSEAGGESMSKQKCNH